MMSTGDVGTAPALPKPLDWLYSARTRQVRSLFIELAQRHAVEYVDLYSAEARRRFSEAPERYYASDGLHPSSEGYRLRFERLLEHSSIAAHLEVRPEAYAPRETD